jgi:hypothetical protein
MKKRNSWIGLILALFIIGAGCSTSRITNSWKAVNTTPGTYNKIMVLGLIRESDRTVQVNMENHLVVDLFPPLWNMVPKPLTI